jgi:hypothetical protein
LTHSAKFFKKRLSRFLNNCKMGGNKLMNKKRILYGGNRSAGQKAGQNQNSFGRIANGNYW